MKKIISIITFLIFANSAYAALDDLPPEYYYYSSWAPGDMRVYFNPWYIGAERQISNWVCTYSVFTDIYTYLLTNSDAVVVWDFDYVYNSISWCFLPARSSNFIFLSSPPQAFWAYGTSYTSPLLVGDDKVFSDYIGYCWFYDYTNRNSSSVNLFIPWDTSQPCLDSFTYAGNTWHSLAIYFGTTPPDPPTPPVPPPGPVTSSINGLTCTTSQFPDVSAATWYNIGSHPQETDLSNTWSIRLRWSETWSIMDYDSVLYTKWPDDALNPSSIPFESVKWPGWTATGILRADWFLNVLSLSGWTNRLFNLVQMNVWSYYEAGGWEALIYVKTQDWQTSQATKSWTGNTLTFSTQVPVNAFGFKFVPSFSGIRIWTSANVEKTQCSVGFNICKWTTTTYWPNCASQDAVNWVPLGECMIAWSGSVYWSGSCIPTVNASGSIIPPSPAAGGYVVRDWSGNIVWSVTIPVSENMEKQFNSAFDCWIEQDASWYATIGQYLVCPVTVAKKLITSGWDGVSKSFNWLKAIVWVVNTLTGATAPEVDTSTWSNPIIAIIREKADMVGDRNNAPIPVVNNTYNMILSLGIFGAIILSLVVFAVILKD